MKGFPSRKRQENDAAAEMRGIDLGFCMAAAIVARDFNKPELAQDILKIADIDRDKIIALNLERNDSAPLLKIVK